MKNLIIIGPPGSGKDTQMDELRKYVKLQDVSAGNIVRELARTHEKFREAMEAGDLIDDKSILVAVEKEIAKTEASEGIVFDGFPRTLHQAEALNEILMHHNRTLDRVIYISLDEDVIVNRLTQRKVCAICGHVVLPGADKCADCGGRAVRRSDDEPAIIINRVQTFLENTLPLVNYYRNKEILLEIDGNQSISAVAKEIKDKLGDDAK